MKQICIFAKGILLVLITSFVFSACKKDPAPEDPFFNEDEYYAGGATTVFDASSAAFSNPASNLSGTRLDLHLDGDAEF
ncbi:MAG: di-heme oxidoredictase family protein, partial [Chitinophagales bacterium]